MSASYAEAMRKANEIREELIRREDNPPQAWEIEQLLDKSGRELIRTFLQEWLDNLAAKELAAKEKVQVDVVGPDGDKTPLCPWAQPHTDDAIWGGDREPHGL